MQLLGGLTKYQETKTKTGIPGLVGIPMLGRLFTGESVDRQRQELMIALIPHIVRRPEYTAENLRGIAVGNQQSVHLNYGRAGGLHSGAGSQERTRRGAHAAMRRAQANPAGRGRANPAHSAAGHHSARGAPALLPPATAPPDDRAASRCRRDQPAATQAAPATPRSRFLPPQVETTAQGTMTVALIIENATDVSSAPLQVTFDPKVVKLNDAGRGDFFSSDGQIPVFTKNIQNDAGAAAMNLNRLPNSPGVSGSGVLTTLIFQGVAKGSTTVTFPISRCATRRAR